LQGAIDSLRTVRAQDREDLEQPLRAGDRNEKRIDKLGQQVSKITFDLDRIKTQGGIVLGAANDETNRRQPQSRIGLGGSPDS
jgi:hypothetical protein